MNLKCPTRIAASILRIEAARLHDHGRDIALVTGPEATRKHPIT
jgi:hypothetical protein